MRIRNRSRRVGWLGCALVFAASSVVLPGLQARAAIVGTQAVLQATRAAALRGEWLAALARDDVREALAERGIDPVEAAERVAHLSNPEVLDVAQRLDTLPAGQGLGGVIVAVALVFALLIILDALGVTDVFPWVEPKS